MFLKLGFFNLGRKDREGERDRALHGTLHREVTTSPGGMGGWRRRERREREREG